MSEREDDFLSRWSRRKTNLRDGGLQKKQDVPAHKPGRMRTDPLPPVEEAPVAEADGETTLIQDASLKAEQSLEQVVEPEVSEVEGQESADPGKFDDFDFDKLNYASDYTQFLKEGVPEAVKRRALRMLWGSNPILANLDGLNDYDEDFTDAALAVKVLSSNYKPGSGYLTEEERIASYSEEARKAGPQPVEDEEDSDVEDLDVEDMDDGEDTPDDVQTASTESDGDAKDEDTPEKNDTA
jgi:hypothetical protein